MSVMLTDFCFLLRVRYSECDVQGVVFNARYGEYVDVALTEFFRCKLGGYHALLNQELDSQIVRQTTQWESPARFDDVIACHVRTVKLGTTSFVIETDMREHVSNRRFALTESVYVMVDNTSFNKIAIPQSIRESLIRISEPVVIDHAGALRLV